MSTRVSHRQLEVETIGPVTVVRFMDKLILEEQEIGALGDQLDSLVEDAGVRKLLLNLGNVQHLSSYLLGKLVRLNRKLLASKGRLALSELHPAIYEGFRASGLTHTFNIYDDEQQGLQSFLGENI